MNAKKAQAKTAKNATPAVAKRTAALAPSPAKKSLSAKVTAPADREYVYAHGSAKDKARTLQRAVQEAGGTARVSANGDTVTCTVRIGSFKGVMTWDAGGAYRYGEESVLDGRRVRNLAAALRLVRSL